MNGGKAATASGEMQNRGVFTFNLRRTTATQLELVSNGRTMFEFVRFALSPSFSLRSSPFFDLGLGFPFGLQQISCISTNSVTHSRTHEFVTSQLSLLRIDSESTPSPLRVYS